ncbi:hypothetical protein [Arcanobacterium hippocoleae]|uniref:Heme exporter protein D n=1 Tax=Arcanobacterium hippocoleae TaxID=149017 RepID=A0ABU1SZZ4_9ACTO|nr:hypothetical protein [Arcanobacterium hippocoleae]MDR6938678.1 hypothetical protein [Arcanobacterium hippocoleae]
MMNEACYEAALWANTVTLLWACVGVALGTLITNWFELRRLRKLREELAEKLNLN